MHARVSPAEVFDRSVPGPRRLLLAASTGGHLSQLLRLAPGLGASDDSVWVTFRTPQSESMLRGRNVVYVPYIRPRDGKRVVSAYTQIRRLLRAERFDGAVSTGSALALAALPAAHLAGIPTLYIESVSRVEGPSMSGRLLAHSRMTQLRTQHAGWAEGRWGVHPSVLETYESVSVQPPVSTPRLFVTLGTIEGYRFDALVERILASGLATDDTVWQLGASAARHDLPGQVHTMMNHRAFLDAARDADVVVTHAGVGTILGLLEQGIHPVAVVRRKDRNEHVDDHQAQIARLLNRLDVGTGLEVDELDSRVIARAARLRVRSSLASSAPARRASGRVEDLAS